jgi:hypothetical protein
MDAANQTVLHGRRARCVSARGGVVIGSTVDGQVMLCRIVDGFDRGRGEARRRWLGETARFLKGRWGMLEGRVTMLDVCSPIFFFARPWMDGFTKLVFGTKEPVNGVNVYHTFWSCLRARCRVLRCRCFVSTYLSD